MSHSKFSYDDADEAGNSLDPAAMLDGTYFDMEIMQEQMREFSKDLGMAGTQMKSNMSEYLSAKTVMRLTNSRAAAMASLRTTKAREKFVPLPPDAALAKLFAVYPPKKGSELEKKFTAESVSEVRSSFPTCNPQQAGFRVDPTGIVILKFDDVRDVHSAKEMAALLTELGVTFPSKKPPHEYISFVDTPDGSPITKCVVTVMATQMALDLVNGTTSLHLENHPANVRVFSAHAVKQGKVLKMEGPLCQWVKKMVMLDVPLQRVLWQATKCLMKHGLMVRSVYLDDDGQAKRLINVDSEDFTLRAEFFSAEDCDLAMDRYEVVLKKRKPPVYEGKSPHDSLLKAEVKLAQFKIERLKDTHAVRLLVKLGESGSILRQLVLEAYGTDSKASVALFLETFFRTYYPHLDFGTIEPETHMDGNVNFRLGISFYYKGSDEDRKSMYAVYSQIASRSDLYNEGFRLDFTRREGEPFNNLLCEIYFNGQQSRQHPPCEARGDADRRSDLEMRSWKNNPLAYFQSAWKKGQATSPFHARQKRLAALREAGMSTPAPPIGSDVERMEEERATHSQADGDRAKLQELVGDALLLANPVHPNFWSCAHPFRPPSEREKAQPNPFDAAIQWNASFLQISPELILTMEWEALQIEESVDELCTEMVRIMEEVKWEGWVPGPAYNQLPVQPATVPSPMRTMSGKDLREVWGTLLWTTNPALLYKALAELIQRGWLVQERYENGLRLTAGPRALTGHCIFAYSEPQCYLMGDGEQLTDEEAMDFSTRMVRTVLSRGALWIPARRLREQYVPPYMVVSRANNEDIYSKHLRSSLEFEQYHFGKVVQHALAGKKILQIASPRSGGIYLVSEKEDARRMLAGVADEDYEPVEWCKRDENRQRLEGVNPPEQTAEDEGGDQSMTDGPATDPRHRAHLDFQLGALCEDETLALALRSEIDKVRINLLPDVITAEIMEQIVNCEAAKEEKHMVLAILTEEGTIATDVRNSLAALAVDLHRVWQMQMELEIIKARPDVGDLVKTRLSNVTMGWAFYRDVQSALRQLAAETSLSTEIRAALSTCATDPGLTAHATAPTERDDEIVHRAAATQQEQIRTEGGSAETEGGAMEAEPQVGMPPTAALPPNVVAVEEPSTDFRRIMISQVEALSEVEGMPDDTLIELSFLSDDISNPEPTETLLDIILVDPGLSDMLQFAIATLARNEMMPINIRGGLAQIAVDTHLYWSFRTQLLDLALKVPQAARLIVTDACHNVAFFRSIAARLQKLALANDISAAQKSMVLGFATSRVIVDGAAAGPQPRAATAEEYKDAGGKRRKAKKSKEERLNPAGSKAKGGAGQP